MTPLLHSFKRIWLCVLRRMRPFVHDRISPYLTPHRVELLRKVFAHLHVNIDGDRQPNGGVFQARIVEDFSVDKSSISRMLSKMERDGFIRRTRWDGNLMYKIVHLTDLGFEIMSVIRDLNFDENAPYEQIEKAFFGHTQASQSEYEGLYRQCNAIRIGLDDNARHLHPWRLRDNVERVRDPELGLFYLRVCRLRVDDVDDRILDMCPDDYLDVFGPFRRDGDADPDAEAPWPAWRPPHVA